MKFSLTKHYIRNTKVISKNIFEWQKKILSPVLVKEVKKYLWKISYKYCLFYENFGITTELQNSRTMILHTVNQLKQVIKF